MTTTQYNAMRRTLMEARLVADDLVIQSIIGGRGTHEAAAAVRETVEKALIALDEAAKAAGLI